MIGDIGNKLIVKNGSPLVNGLDRLMSKVNRPHPVDLGWPQSHRETDEGMADLVRTSVEGNLGCRVDLSNFLERAVFDGWQAVRKSPRARLVATRWDRQPESLVGTDQIVFIPPAIEHHLGV